MRLCIVVKIDRWAGADERSRRSGGKGLREIYQWARAAHALPPVVPCKRTPLTSQWQSPPPIKSLGEHAKLAGSGWPLDAEAPWPTGGMSHLYVFGILGCDTGAVALNSN